MISAQEKLVLACLGFVLALAQVGALAQPAAAPAPIPAAASPAAALRQILIADSPEAAQAMSAVPGGGIAVVSPSLWFINQEELKRRLATGENRPINEQLLSAIALVVETAVRELNYPQATAAIPPQDVVDGILRLVVTLNQPPPPPPASTSKPIHLRQILIAETVEAAQAMQPVAGGSFVVLGPALSFLKADQLTKILADGENKVLDDRILVAIARVIEATARSQDLPIATAIIPPQNIADGTLRVALLLGKFREIKFQGNRWFSESLLRDTLLVGRGEIVRLSEIDRSVSWTNNSPFRRVRVHIDPIPNTGEANLIVGVQERIPLRLTASYDNGGSEVIGKHRYTAAVSYANLWGRDHQASYQFVTTDKPEYFKGHAFDYRVPLPWRHYAQVSASYFTAEPEIYEGLFVNRGESLTSDLRYTVPLRAGVNNADVFAALTFKQSNNNLTWDPRGNNVQILGTKTDVFQFSLGASTVRRDKRGGWALGVSLTASPGNVNSRNTDAAYDAGRFGRGDSARIGAKARYAYGILSAQRLLTLAPGWDFTSRLMIQVAEANLLSSEQMSVGGSATVRGFNENVFAGDHGIVFSNELLAPSLKTNLPKLSRRGGPMETRFLAFYEMADTGLRRRYPIDTARPTLRSTGLGVRMNFATNFALVADYGWQLSKLPYLVDRHTKGHVKVTLAY